MQVKVETIKNEMTSKKYINFKIKNITKTYNFNKSVFLQLTVHASDIKFCDSLDCHISENQICFDSNYQILEAQLLIISKLQNVSKL